MEQLTVTKVLKAAEEPDLPWLTAREPQVISGHNVQVEVGHIGDALKSLSEHDGFRLHRIAKAKEATAWLLKELKVQKEIIKTESDIVGRNLAKVIESDEEHE